MQNYKKYSDCTFAFAEGLTGIIGRNGTGKSTLFNAIGFALYGEVRGEKETLRYVKAGVKEAVIVTLCFEIENQAYRVVRELRGKLLTAKAFLYNSEDCLIAKSTKGVTAEVIRLVGMNKEAFVHTVFASQKELTALSGLKSEERKKMIRKLLGLEKIDKIEQEIRIKLTELNREIKSFSNILLSEAEVNALHEEIESKTKTYQRQKESVEENIHLLKVKENALKETEALLRVFQEEKEHSLHLASELQVMYTKLDNLLKNQKEKTEKRETLQKKAEKYQKQKSLLSDYKALEREIERLQQAQLKYERQCALEKEEETLRSRYREIETEIKRVKEKLQREPQLLLTLEKERDALKGLRKEYQEFEEREKILHQEIAGYEELINDTYRKLHTIETLGKESSCPTCTRPLLEEYEYVVFSLKESIEKIHRTEVEKRVLLLKRVQEGKQKEKKAIEAKEESLQKLTLDKQLLEADKKVLLREEEAFMQVKKRGIANKEALESVGEVNFDETRYRALLLEREASQTKYEALLGVEKLLAQLPMLEEALETIEAEITQIKEQISKQKSMIATQQYNSVAHQEYEALLIKHSQEKEKISQTLTKEKVALQKCMGDMDVLKNTQERNHKQEQMFHSIYEEKKSYEKLKVLMGAFKNRINTQLSPRISHLASEMYASITRGKYQHIEVNHAFDFFIYDEGVRYPIERFSGGEVDLANLVLRIAISQTLSELNGSSKIAFLAFDEVFGSQDKERRYEMMEAFHTIKGQYRQIFLISHESEMIEMFENMIELE